MSLALNGIRATSVRLLTPWIGAWVADVDLDLGELLDLPTGPAVLIVGTQSLLGTIDPAQSGRNGPLAKARVVGGAGGWEKTVGAKHYHNDAGVLSTAVFATTGAEVLERVVEALPSRLGADYVRTAGPAARVLSGKEWHVDLTGTTIVGPRFPVPAVPTSVRVLDWDARSKIATIAADDIVEPGTVLADTKFGTAKIRDVEQTWGDSGSRATAWTVAVDVTPPSKSGGELVAALGAIAKEAAGASFLPTFRYRVITQEVDGRFILQAVNKESGIPDLRSISLAPGVPGMSVKVAPGTIAHIVFIDADRTQPVVVRFEDGPPFLEVAIGEAATGVATQASQAAFTTTLVSLLTTLQAFLNFAGVIAVSGSTAQPCAAAAAALATAAVLPTNYSLRVKAGL